MIETELGTLRRSHYSNQINASLDGMDSILSIVQMPFGIPVGTVAIGETGAKNAALYAASILSLNDKKIANNLRIWRNKQTLSVKNSPKK